MRHPTRRQPDRPRAAGFSLVELLLTAVIIGVVAAIGVPRYANALSRYHLDAAARRVVADLQRAQTHAESTSKATAVLFDPAADTVSLPDLAGLAASDPYLTTDLGQDPYRADLTAASFDGDPRLEFDGYGTPVHGGTVTLRAGGAARVITVDGITGEASIQ